MIFELIFAMLFLYKNSIQNVLLRLVCYFISEIQYYCEIILVSVEIVVAADLVAEGDYGACAEAVPLLAGGKVNNFSVVARVAQRFAELYTVHTGHHYVQHVDVKATRFFRLLKKVIGGREGMKRQLFIFSVFLCILLRRTPPAPGTRVRHRKLQFSYFSP